MTRLRVVDAEFPERHLLVALRARVQDLLMPLGWPRVRLLCFATTCWLENAMRVTETAPHWGQVRTRGEDPPRPVLPNVPFGRPLRRSSDTRDRFGMVCTLAVGRPRLSSTPPGALRGSPSSAWTSAAAWPRRRCLPHYRPAVGRQAGDRHRLQPLPQHGRLGEPRRLARKAPAMARARSTPGRPGSHSP